ncbi:hypothetical protein G9A89_018695 [Geosiphon pyriformis]|nr:hypothetical protein G9A89_018695 [Geosiphon pyriformis]
MFKIVMFVKKEEEQNPSQEKQKERHDSQLPDKPVEFKIGDKVLLHHIKTEKQWSGKFDPK